MNLDPSLRKVASALYCYLNTPTSLACYILLKYGEFEQLVSKAADSACYVEGPWGAERYRRDAQACDFLRKSPIVPLRGVSRRKKAVATFHECEERCLNTNNLMKLLRYPSRHESAAEGAFRVILRNARKLAGRILGPLPDELFGSFGPGTSFEMKGQTFQTVADKLWITPHVTSAAGAVFDHSYWQTHWGRQRLKLGLPLPAQCRGNRFTTVPKDATKDRGICIEPLGNLWCQLAVGRHLKRRLGAIGIRVDRSSAPDCPLKRLTYRPPETGKELHNRLARDGSLTGEWATIDLSNASDTVALELVREVLPPDWFDLLYALRSPFTFIEGKWVRLEKFSSMGNGYTFELETALFVCLVAVTCGLTPGVDLFCFGDDIILPSRSFRDATAVLKMAGFEPNERKSFGSGPFRESCGGDYFSGFNVRSIFCKKKMDSPLDWVALHNGLKSKWPRASLVLKRCVDPIPARLRLFGPARLGDSVLHGTPTRCWSKDGVRWIATIRAQPLTLPLDRWGSEFTLTLALLGVPSEGLTPRGEIRGYLITKASVS